MTIRVLVNGANGRMGKATVEAIQSETQLQLVGKADRYSDLAAMIESTKANVVVDFTVAGAGFINTKRIIQAGAYPVIGTSGFQAHEIATLNTLCTQEKHGAIIAPNFSIAAVLMIQCAQHIAQHMPNIEIIELHHDRKQDAPSGTALYTASALQKIKETTKQRAACEKMMDAHATAASAIPIHSVRLPGLFAHQAILFGKTGETLTLRHDAIDRACMMPGVLFCCKKVMTLKRLVYGMEHIL